ncbi:monovalent cation:H+ antiporter, CPA1 (nhx1), variant 2 [Entomophthora muscae]|nr:monovalent cation:H+ antiporter, CPA1 (nhx1), variant 2 [Entomophthora muscae]
MFVGFIIRMQDDENLRKMVSFKFTVFFNLLLPPIILNSGYELEREHFFKNLGFILAFAFVGTTISAVVIGAMVYLVNLLSLDYLHMSAIECLMMGSILSSTDPVTVLAIFSQLGVDPKLYAIIFGESMLNDSVAIVMFETLQHVTADDSGDSLLLSGLSEFFRVFFGSLAVGMVMGLACALMLKFTTLHKFHSLEACLVMLLAYGTYFLSNAVELSGIVSLLFCSIVLKHYAFINLSVTSQRTTKMLFAILSQLSENFCFIYLGITLFTGQKEDYSLMLIACTVIICCVARFCSTIPLAKLINYCMRRFYHSSEDAIPHSYQLMLFWAGLRGAVAFALAMEIETENASLMRSTILIVVVFTLLFFGGTTPLFIRHFDIQTGVSFPQSSSYSDDEDANSPAEDSIELFAKSSLSLDRGPEALFRSLDDQYLKPIFTKQSSGNFDLIPEQEPEPEPETGHSLFEFDEAHFELDNSENA